MDVQCVRKNVKVIKILSGLLIQKVIVISIVLKGLLKWQNMLTTIMENRGKTNEHILSRP